jgi:site-specific recombinase XerD
LLSQVSTSSNKSALLDRKIEETAAGLPKYYIELLRSVAKDNAATIVEYIYAMKIEVNLSDNYRRVLVEVLSRFSKYNNDRPFKDLVRTDIISFLETYRKTEAANPLHKWIGTYNIYRMHLHQFFKWLYLDANSYATSMTGLKYKLAHKRIGREKWSSTDNVQRKLLIQILQELIDQLKMEDLYCLS